MSSRDRAPWAVVDTEPNGVGRYIAPGTLLPVLWRGASEEEALQFLDTLDKKDVEAGRYGVDGPA